MTEAARAREIAEAVGVGMFERDRTAKKLGIGLVSIAPGEAVMTMTVADDMVNGHDICHGGLTFTLADTCFAYACNSRNRISLAQTASISFIRAARKGDMLTATGRAAHQGGRSGIYDISVTDQEGRLIALFRGNSRTIEGEVVEGLGREP